MEQETDHIIPLSDAQKADVVSTLNLVHQEIRAMRGLFRMQMGDKTIELPIGHYDWQDVPGPGCIEIAAIPPDMWPCAFACNCKEDCDTDYFFVRGEVGTKRLDIQVAQAMRLELLYGKIWVWKESAPAYILYEGGDTLLLKNMEKHSIFVEDSYFGNLSFTPKLPLYE